MTGGGDQHSAAAPSSGIFRFSAAAAHKNTNSAADDTLVMISQSVFTITEKAPARALSWLKVPNWRFHIYDTSMTLINPL